MAAKKSKKSKNVAEKNVAERTAVEQSGTKPVLLSGGDPQIARPTAMPLCRLTSPPFDDINRSGSLIGRLLP